MSSPGINFGTPDEYSFTMEDSTSVPVAEGTLKVTDVKDSTISGTYNLSKIYQEQYPGLNTMKGIFSGTISASVSKAFLNMNPKISDNNIFVNLNIYKSYMDGDWYYSTMQGKNSQGHFKAYKLK
jgi:hypothetical protein